jgi:pyridoxine 5-phosphate synthase
MTERGALDVGKGANRIRDAVEVLHDRDIQASLFIEPDIETIELSKECGADLVEFHTGAYAGATDRIEIDKQIELIYKAAEHASNIRIKANAGCGLDYRNVVPLLHARELLELNIGRAIILRADSIGLWKAVEEMMEVLD